MRLERHPRPARAPPEGGHAPRVPRSSRRPPSHHGMHPVSHRANLPHRTQPARAAGLHAGAPKDSLAGKPQALQTTRQTHHPPQRGSRHHARQPDRAYAPLCHRPMANGRTLSPASRTVRSTSATTAPKTRSGRSNSARKTGCSSAGRTPAGAAR